MTIVKRVCSANKGYRYVNFDINGKLCGKECEACFHGSCTMKLPLQTLSKSDDGYIRTKDCIRYLGNEKQ